MRTVRNAHSQTIADVQCPHCGQKHSFNFRVVIDAVVDVSFMMRFWVETTSCAVVCPTKGEEFMVDVPVTLYSGQSLVSVR